MSLLKEMVARGIYYDRLGAHDYAVWSEMMVDFYGTELRNDIREVRRWSILIPERHDIRVMKLNCWDFMGCGLQRGGKRVREADYGVCPAAEETRLEGVHGGTYAGRACWMVSHTHCNRTVQGTSEEKRAFCMDCDFYKSVQEEEALAFMNHNALKTMLQGGKDAHGPVY